MPRKPQLGRLALPGHSEHIVHQTHGAPWFFHDDDRRCYLKYLCDACGSHGCAVHAYALMPDHVHLLMSSRADRAVARVMLAIDDNYVRYIRDRYRCGDTPARGRLKANIIDCNASVLTCSRDIEIHPVRAGLAIRPGDYVWSSYRSNALGMENKVLTPHHCYLALHRHGSKRRVRYRKLFEPDCM